MFFKGYFISCHDKFPVLAHTHGIDKIQPVPAYIVLAVGMADYVVYSQSHIRIFKYISALECVNVGEIFKS